MQNLERASLGDYKRYKEHKEMPGSNKHEAGLNFYILIIHSVSILNKLPRTKLSKLA